MITTVQKQVLINARALIADPAHWTRGTIARTANGRKVEWHDQSATKWCAMGAMYRAAYDLVGDQKQAVRIGNGQRPGQQHTPAPLAPRGPLSHKRCARPHRSARGIRQSLTGGIATATT